MERKERRNCAYMQMRIVGNYEIKRKQIKYGSDSKNENYREMQMKKKLHKYYFVKTIM